ncbi:MAG: hypothetical protein GXY76_15955 [Chloroflexi bacterium]|nr:hypothetical protein [Chloroflexota bacterium]
MNTYELREYLLARAPWVDRAKTVDTIKAGDPYREVKRVAVGWMSTILDLRAAHELGCDLFITHEPTFWEHSQEERELRGVEPGLTKQRFLDQTGMVVLRVHDTWDYWPEIGIRESWARGLGLTQLVGEDETRLHGVYAVEPQTLGQFAAQVATRVKPLGEDCVRVMGDPERPVSRVAVGVGCLVPDKDAVDMGADALVVCYDGATYWRKRERIYELGVGVIVVEHGTSELWGLESLARYLGETFPELEVHSVANAPVPWTVFPRDSAAG